MDVPYSLNSLVENQARQKNNRLNQAGSNIRFCCFLNFAFRNLHGSTERENTSTKLTRFYLFSNACIFKQPLSSGLRKKQPDVFYKSPLKLSADSMVNGLRPADGLEPS